MTTAEIKKFYESQVTFYAKMLSYNDSEIAFLSGQIKRARKDDKEMVDFVWASGVVTAFEMDRYTKDYTSIETEKLLKERKKEYAARQKNRASLAEYQIKLAAIIAEEMEEAPAETESSMEEAESTTEQKYTSAATSINSTKLPAVYTSKAFLEEIGKAASVSDFGAGKFDNAEKYVFDTFGKVVYCYDKYNRTEAENADTLSRFSDLGIISNVLNVIDNAEARKNLLKLAREHAATVLITVYEGDGSGKGRPTKEDCWQENRKLASYIPEVLAVFQTVERKGAVLIAR